MKVAYRISKQDQTAFHKFLQQRVRRLARIPLKWKAIAWVLLVLSFFLAIRFSDTDVFHELIPLRADVFLTILAAIAFVGYLVIYFKRLRDRKISTMGMEEGPLLGDYSIESSPDGFVVTGPFTQTKFDWNAIQAAEENEGFIYILIDNAVGLQIPKSIFSSPREAQDFLEIFVSKARG